MEEDLLDVEKLRHASLCDIRGRAFDLGFAAYELKAKNEANAAYFAASKLLGRITYTNSMVRKWFQIGWGKKKYNLGHFKNDPRYRDLPRHLMGPSHIPQEAYQRLAQR